MFYQEVRKVTKMVIPFLLGLISSFLYIIFIDLHNFGTGPMILFRRGFLYKRRVKASKDGRVLIHLGALEHYTLSRVYQILLSHPWATDRESVLEINLHSWNQLLHWPCSCKSLMWSCNDRWNLWSH